MSMIDPARIVPMFVDEDDPREPQNVPLDEILARVYEWGERGWFEAGTAQDQIRGLQAESAFRWPSLEVIEKVLRVHSGEDFLADDFPTAEDGVAAWREWQRLLPQLRSIIADEGWAP